MGTVSTGGGVSLIEPIQSDSEVIINLKSDLPPAVAGVIQLQDQKIYIFGSGFSLGTDRINLGVNNVVTADNPLSSPLEYTGTGTMFTGVDVNFTIRDIFLDCPNGQIFDLSSGAAGNFFLMQLCITLSCNKYATVDNLRTIDWSDSSALSAHDGVTITGTGNWNIYSISKFSLITSSTSFIGMDFDASVHNALEISNFIVRGVPGSIGIKGLPASGNVVSGELATVGNSDFTGGITILDGILYSDIRWAFLNNTAIPNSFSDSLSSLSGNTTETVIVAPSTDGSNAVKVAGTWVNENSVHFTVDSTGKTTYIKEIATSIPVTLSAGIKPASGNNTLLTAYLAFNGVVNLKTGVQVNAGSTRPSALTCIWQFPFAITDFIEVYVENNSNTVNIIVDSAIVRVN